jgi:hypothetical protein
MSMSLRNLGKFVHFYFEVLSNSPTNDIRAVLQFDGE